MVSGIICFWDKTSLNSPKKLYSKRDHHLALGTKRLDDYGMLNEFLRAEKESLDLVCARHDILYSSEMRF